MAAAIGGGRRRRFTYKTKGVFVDMGRQKAIAQTLGVTWRGLPAWLLARTYHLVMMPGLGRRARLLVDWNIGVLFGRDSAELGGLGPPRPLGATVEVGGVSEAGADGVPGGGVVEVPAERRVS